MHLPPLGWCQKHLIFGLSVNARIFRFCILCTWYLTNQVFKFDAVMAKVNLVDFANKQAADRTCRPTYTQHLHWQELHYCRSAGVQQSTVSVATGRQLWTVQMTTENISVCQLTNHSTLHCCWLICTLAVFLLTYLLTLGWPSIWKTW